MADDETTHDLDPLEPPERKPFAMVLQEMRKGGLHTEMGDELAALVAKCMETGKQGSLDLKIVVKPNDDGQTVTTTDKIVVKAPRADVPTTLFWPDANGNLSRTNPHQLDISALREVPGGRAAVEDPTHLKEARRP